ncbi:DNA adenine methylase [Pseudoalteromonas sp. Isolate3]|uniref:DNA adenine methylase n=1 Tax=Pseudoalteromonas sp. Isolate3 TaxID=2908526 RepID=UPI001EFE37E2|nr:DNA adenine methylase [Pseudoalteromonas sp. Isolate3]MCG9708258.1 DNA adenine methylase [Pseudoalteromonas sp. Isolate3]
MHTPLLRYHGGKYRLSKWLYGFFPEHTTYVEPFGGAASVLLRKKRCHGEVYNDLDQDIFNLFQVLRNKSDAEELIQLCHLTPYSRDEFKLAYEFTSEPIERARRTIVRSAMGFGSGAASGHPTGFRCEASRKYATSSHCWQKYPPVLRFVHERLQGVNIENRPAVDCMVKHDAPGTLHYVDPPYLFDTRKINSSGGVYRHEMTTSDHEALLNELKKLDGSVILSGYPSDLYNDLLSGWRLENKQARISAGSGTGLRTECIWLNPACVENLKKGYVGMHHTSRAAYITHHVRAEKTENAIRAAIEKLMDSGETVTKKAVADITGVSREQISRRYSHCFK